MKQEKLVTFINERKLRRIEKQSERDKERERESGKGYEGIKER